MNFAGRLVVDLIAGRNNDWSKLYEPGRKTLKPKVLADYAVENANVVAQFRDCVTPGEESRADKMKSGEGAVLRKGTRKIATYRDANGVLHEFSAVCPHLKCIVRWDHCDQIIGCELAETCGRRS